MLEKHGIKKEPSVKLNRDIRVTTLSHLRNQPTNTAQAIHRRRASVASSSLFVFGNTVREAGFDFFERIPRSNQVNVGASTSASAQIENTGTSDTPRSNQVNVGVSTSASAASAHIENTGTSDTQMSQINGNENAMVNENVEKIDNDASDPSVEHIEQLDADSGYNKYT